MITHDPSLSFLKGDLVKTISQQNDSILLDPSLVSPSSDLNLFDTVIEQLGKRDWSSEPSGKLNDEITNVYLLDSNQLENLLSILVINHLLILFLFRWLFCCF